MIERFDGHDKGGFDAADGEGASRVALASHGLNSANNKQLRSTELSEQVERGFRTGPRALARGDLSLTQESIDEKGANS